MASTLNKRVTIWINDRQVNNSIASIQKEITSVRNEMKKLTIGTAE